MSHELRTPLNAIIGFSELMEQALFGPLGSERYEEYATDINSSGKYLLGVINDILDMSKIEAGQFSIDREQIDLGPLISETVRVVSLQAAQKAITVETRIADSLSLVADRRAIKQIVINLLSNAVKFTGQGGHIVVKARNASGALTLTIEDNGCGIPKTALGKLGRPFEQVQNQFSKNHTGSTWDSRSRVRWPNCMAARSRSARRKAPAPSYRYASLSGRHHSWSRQRLEAFPRNKLRVLR